MEQAINNIDSTAQHSTAQHSTAPFCVLKAQFAEEYAGTN